MRGRVVFYQDDSEPRNQAWRWKFVTSDNTVITVSDVAFKTRRGAMDDWNRVERVVSRLERGVGNE